MEIRKQLARLYKWEYFWLSLIVIITLILHLSVITRPPDLILDEQHYIPDARSIISGNGDPRPEHPTLAKLLIVSSIKIFGDNPVGWRAYPVLFGTFNILFLYLICRNLRMSRRASNLATFLLGFENMSFVQSSVAMLDVFCLTFMLASFWLYARKNYTFAALAVGLSALCKMTGALAGGVIVFHWLVVNRKYILQRNWRPVADFLASMLVAPFSFFAFMPVFDYLATREWQNPFARVIEMMNLMSTLTFANTQHEALSRPWMWLISPKGMAYWYTPNYTSAISYGVWALIIPTCGYMLYRMFKGKLVFRPMKWKEKTVLMATRIWRGNSAATFGVMWFFFTYVTWIPASIITDRISFVFYFYPAVGAICLGLGLAFDHYLNLARKRKNALHWVIPALIVLFLVAHLVIFGIISPVLS